MRMQSKLAEILLASAIIGGGSMGSPYYGEKSKGIPAVNGNWRRSHKLNVKRKRLRRITAKSKAINRK